MTMKDNNILLSLLLYLSTVLILYSCVTSDAAKIPVSVAPYYNSDPLRINVGELSDKLMSENSKDIVELSANLKPDDATIPTEALYVLAIRLFDLNEKDKASYWFYNALYRTKLLELLLTQDSQISNSTLGNEALVKLSSYNAFAKQIAPFLHDSISQNSEELDIINMVQKDMRTLDVKGFINDFPVIAETIANEHPEVVQKINEGLFILKDIIQTNMDEIVNQTNYHR